MRPPASGPWRLALALLLVACLQAQRLAATPDLWVVRFALAADRCTQHPSGPHQAHGAPQPDRCEGEGGAHLQRSCRIQHGYPSTGAWGHAQRSGRTGR